MTACFHVAGVQCDNCYTGLRDDRLYVATVTTGGTYFSSQDFLDALRRIEIERDEARKEAAEWKARLDLAPQYTFRGGYVEDSAGDRWWSADLLTNVEAERDAWKARAEAAEDTIRRWQEDWREGRRDLLAWAKEES